MESVDQTAEPVPTDAAQRALADHEVVGDIDAYRFPSNRRRCYEALDADAFPDGLLVVGDAVASFNPIYAQGMSVSALEALALHHALAAGGTRSLARRFFETAAPVVDHAWEMALGADAPFAPDDASIPTHVRAFTAYFDHLTRVAQSDGDVSEALMRVISMEKGPESLFRPGTVGRVLASSLPTTDSLPGRPTATVEGLADALHLRSR